MISRLKPASNKHAAPKRGNRPKIIGKMSDLNIVPSFRENGIKEGMEKARQMLRIAHARALLANGIKWEVITKSIGVTPQDLENAQANLKENSEFSS